MTEAELFAHYEKLYFHEQGRKEQIFSRLNIPLAVMVAIIGFYAVIISGDHKSLQLGPAIWFWVILSCSLASLLIGAVFFVDALLGKMDSALSTPNALETWRQELLEYYKADPNQDEIVAAEVKRSLYVDYMKCASVMTINNDRKASSLYYCNIAVIVAVAFAAVAYVIVKFPSL